MRSLPTPCSPTWIAPRLVALLGAFVALLVSPAGAEAKQSWSSYERPAEFGVVSENEVPIQMRDETVLRAKVTRPDAPGRFPVIITQTPYNKGIPLLGGTNDYLVARGYVHVVVDVRGTGSSEGRWDSFGPAEQADGPDVVAWARKQPWSDGKVGLFGPSYMGLNQLYTAAQRPPGLKAIFPIVPLADGYRDIVFSGGQVNLAFIPLWLGLVSAGSVVPPALVNPAAGLAELVSDLLTTVSTLLDHVVGVADFQLKVVTDAILGGETAYDGSFWKTRSPIEVLDSIEVPTFVVGGLHDLFQRGEPLIYERLKSRVNARLLMGPWTHLGGSSGAGLPADGVPELNGIALRWFDRYLKGMPTRVGKIPDVTQYVFGRDRYEVQPDWPDPRIRPTRLHLRADEELDPRPAPGSERPDSFLQQPLNGFCTQSTSQWTAGLTEALPCTTDNRLNEALELTYTTPPMKRPMRISGPAMADLWVRTTRSDAVLAVRITDVAPSGKSTELTGGWLAGSFRATDRSKSRRVRGHMLQPWHPYTRESVRPVPAGKPIRMRAEIFPTNAVIKKGHSLRVSVGPSDFPHSLPPLPQLLNSLAGKVDVLHSAEHPSGIELPTVRPCGDRKPKRCKRSLPVPDLTR